MEKLYESFACAGIGQGKRDDRSAPLHQQDVKGPPFKLPLDYRPTGKVVIAPSPRLFWGRNDNAFVAKTDLFGASKVLGIQPVKQSEETCDGNGKAEESNGW